MRPEPVEGPSPTLRQAQRVFVRSLAEGGDRAELGGKGASLARLWSAGLPVPDGFVVTVDAFRAYAAAGSMPTDVAADVAAAYLALGAPPVAVRSSATTEDAADASYAGQHDSFLNVAGDDDVLAAVERCWASLDTERAVAYRARHSSTQPGLAVVVQRMVDADAAGVLFTVDPITGDDAVITVNAAWGLGEAVVSGQVTPDTFAVDRASGRLRDRSLVLELRHDRPTLTDAQVERLAGLGVRIEALDSEPVDVEWCRTGDDLWIVQARPITTMRAELVEAPSTGSGRIDRDPWNDSRTGDFLWTNTNVGEAIPDVMTPATWSMVQVFMTDAMATASVPPYRGWGRIGGRIYLNVSVMKALSGAVGVSEGRFRTLTAEVFGQLPADLEIPPVPAGRLRILRAVAPMAVHVISEARRDVKVLNSYLAAHPELCDRRRAEIDGIGDPRALAGLWTDTLNPEFHRVSWMLSAATRSSGASFVTTRMRLQRLLGDAGANALTSGLGGGQAGQLASLGLLDGLDQLARGEIDRDTFNRRYGHRGPHEFEISTPRPAEDPDWIDEQLAQRAGSTGPAYADLLQQQQRRREEAWTELERRHPWHAKMLGRQLAVWTRIARDRERARSEVIRYFWVLRSFVRRAGALTGLGDDVFFLDAAEIVRLLRGETIGPRLIAERRKAYAGYAALPPYPPLIRGRFDPYAWAADPDRRLDLFVAGDRRPAADTVRGFPGSSGVVEGVVRVLTDAADGGELGSGEVLVTTVTNVGWTPLFPRLAAVVTDVGAPLSHAAIVARELGIPAVVGCGNATMRLRTGDRVRVDGSAGTVEVLPVSEPASSPSSTAPTGTRPTSVSEEDA
ncbi:MAG TPA: PEP/pyruvate-binding domain-containing protein [Propionibacteriaceae bacterium]|nr:PEP/pyruvate-binding domain-containing protein [Propionibacteriaceae bacterium]